VLAGGGHRLRSSITLSEGEQISVVLRAEQLKLVTTVPQGTDNVLHGHVRRLTFQGGNIECEVDLGGSLSLRVPMPADLDLDKGVPVAVIIRTLEGSVFRTGPADTHFHEIA
jgi:ABC-type molybdate transport system ATPase subunit